MLEEHRGDLRHVEIPQWPITKNWIRLVTDIYFVVKTAGHTNPGFTLSRYGGVLEGEEQAEVAKAALEASVGRLL